MTRMKLTRNLAAWRLDLTGYRDFEEAYKIALESLARHYHELHDEVADLDDMIEAIVTDLAPELIARNGLGLNSAAQLLLKAGDNPERLRSGECHELCVSGLAHAGFRYSHALKRSSNIMAK
ncbi:hypothetical protein SAMN04488512_12643 [Sulfitobacter litoralis]|uniref:Uncharacterized protein n=1 Tax=Sulfitobacter litoralis TaxID=335975 RepID=A0ABY0SWJ2_9RHOB|nr:hypothetical protein SAMN04488512_12643 [Sulfitobacter litoralis]